MKKMLITGGTVFVSRYAAEYFAARDWDVYVLNRNTRPQSKGVTLIQADRRQLGEALGGRYFDAVLDITAYNAGDVEALLDSGVDFGRYILLSSSAVYPDSSPQPFSENTPVGENAVWGKYGTDKIGAENVVLNRVPGGYIIRPPYLYGPMNNIYREAFVFECALEGREFYIPGDGELKLQFFHVDDLCRLMAAVLENPPRQRIFNAGNPQPVNAAEWVRLCYRAAGREAQLVSVPHSVEQRKYFSFYNYEYFLNPGMQQRIMSGVIPLEQGLKESFDWYVLNRDKVVRKPLIEYIDTHLK